MTEKYDVIIVGSGPAGSIAALTCANHNLKTIVIDKKESHLIGDKVCGEALSKKTVTALSNLVKISPPKDKEINAEIAELVLQTSNKDVKITYPAIGYMINRLTYGQRLLNEIKAKGVSIKSNTQVTRPIVENSKVIGVEIKENEKITQIYGKITIDASGVYAVIRTNLPENIEPLLYKKLEKTDYASCYREIIKFKEKDHELNGKIVLQYEKDIPEPGYLWFFADGEKKLNCGTGFVKHGKNKGKSVKKVYKEAMEKYFSSSEYEVIDGRGGLVSIKEPLWNSVAPGLIVTGDAAFHADPLTAEGHGPAMWAGKIAGDIAKEAINKGKWATEDLWDYNRRIIEQFGLDNARYRVVALILESIGADNLEFLIRRKVIKQSDLTSSGISKKESLSSTIGRGLRCLPKVNLLFLMKKALSANRKLEVLLTSFPNSPNDYTEWLKKVDSVYKKFS